MAKGKEKTQIDEIDLAYSVSRKAFYDAMYEHLLEMAYEDLKKNPELRAITEEYLFKISKGLQKVWEERRNKEGR